MFLNLLAQLEDYYGETPELPDFSEIPDMTGAAAAAGLIWGGLVIFWLVFGLISFAFFIWWIVLIIDLAKRDFPQKTTYLILMIVSLFVPFMMIVMDFVYYFGIVKKGVGKTTGSASPPPQSPPESSSPPESPPSPPAKT